MRRLALAVVLLAACSDDEPARPRPVDREERAERPEKRAASAPRDVEERAAPPATHPAGVATAPPPLTVGQWVRYRLQWRAGAESTVTYRIVGAEDGAYWMEVDDRRRGARHVMKLLVEVGDRTDPDSLSVRELITNDDGHEKRLPERMVRATQPMLRQFLSILFSDWSGATRETVTTPAGTFEEAFKHEQELSFGGATMQADVWHHPVVPISGMVRFRSHGDRAHELELIGFGATGAQAALP